MLTDEGGVYGVGHNNAGQLGQDELPAGKTCSSVPLEIFMGTPIASIGCGWEHCAAISTAGELFLWGRADSGQCSVPPDRRVVTTPVRVELGSDGSKVHSVSCGVSHTLAIDDSGACWSWGQGFQVRALPCQPPPPPSSLLWLTHLSLHRGPTFYFSSSW
jgi:alpha-tubulin suppressor-like RCC1 family protein